MTLLLSSIFIIIFIDGVYMALHRAVAHSRL